MRECTGVLMTRECTGVLMTRVHIERLGLVLASQYCGMVRVSVRPCAGMAPVTAIVAGMAPVTAIVAGMAPDANTVPVAIKRWLPKYSGRHTYIAFSRWLPFQLQ